MKKKVLFTATVDSHILQFHLPFLKLFKDNGYEVHVATNSTDGIPYCDVKHCVSFEKSPLSFKNLLAIKQLKKICNNEKFDIIHTHTPMGSVVTRLAAKKARKKYGTRVIYTAHGLHFFKGAPIKNWLIFYPVEKYLSKYTDTLILIKKEDYILAKNRFKKCLDIHFVPGVGVDENLFTKKTTKENKKKLLDEFGLTDKSKVLIFPARLDRNKNHVFLINAFEKLVEYDKNIHLLLPGVDELDGLNQKLVEEKHLDKNIHFLGYRKDIYDLLSISNISVSSSLREGLPVNILEACFKGLPVVAKKCTGISDLVSDGENGFIVESENQFVEKVILLFENEKLYKTISSNNKIKSKNYSLSIILNIMSDIYGIKVIK